jgi:Zn finger protein HypA/HybF involved in hydrogenase expression
MAEIECSDCSSVVDITVVDAKHQPVLDNLYCPVCGSEETHVVG